MLDRIRALTETDEGSGVPCGCEPARDGSRLTVDAGDCDAGGDLVASPACRASATDAIAADEDVTSIEVVRDGRARDYRGDGPALLSAAARFAVAVGDDEPRLARQARRNPLGAAGEAAGRAGTVSTLATEAGLARFAAPECYEAVFVPRVGLAISPWRRDPRPPPDGRLVDRRTLDSGATVRRYAVGGRSPPVYHLEPAEATLDFDACRTLCDARAYLSAAPLGGEERSVTGAVRAVASDDVAMGPIARVLRKYCRSCGLLGDFFADPALSDVFVTAPATRTRVRVQVDGETLATNVSVGEAGVAALASRFRRESGRGFSRARPTLDAATTVAGRRVRVAGVTEPVSEGDAFAFRAHDRSVWTLPALVANDTMPANAAGLLSLAVERGGATLLAGPRASGKTTTLGALLWAVPPSVRCVVIEDAPELPVEPLQTAGRDVQALRTEADGGLAPAEALRTALRLGDGALVVGEVRGEEAGVLYEAMRVGANSEAVLGTIHGDGGDAVFERVVSDLGVPASAFGATDLLVSQETATVDGDPVRRVRAIEEILDGEAGAFASLFERTDAGLESTGRIDRGNSRAVATLARPDESYSDVRAAIRERSQTITALARTGRTGPEDVTTAMASGHT